MSRKKLEKQKSIRDGQHRVVEVPEQSIKDNDNGNDVDNAPIKENNNQGMYVRTRRSRIVGL